MRQAPSYLLHSPLAKQWQKVGVKPHHGIAVPLFSLHSRQSYGIGEYTDLKLLIDFCFSTGLDTLQLLPLNDTGEATSPYSLLSAFALNPIYIGLQELPGVQEDAFLLSQLRNTLKLPHSALIDIQAVRKNKLGFLRHYFARFFTEISSGDGFKEFLKNTGYWLRGYCAFKILKEKYGGLPWWEWPQEAIGARPDFIERVITENGTAFDWFCFLQFLCDCQLKEAKNYAESKNVFLMGDIPILLDKDSADVWLHEELFDLHFSAGAPPDMYSENGQNWGFPLYRWEAMKRCDYSWWKERLKYATHYYHIYRIDHIVGFFRIWAIPEGRSGKEGFFIPEDPSLWIDQGRKILMMMIESCDMLPIGEDLGCVPSEVRVCLSALGICGTKVMRWERYFDQGGSFIPPEDYPCEGMTTVSTHDSETLRQWWRDYPDDAQRLAREKGWTYSGCLSREQLKELLWDSHHTSSVFHINPLQEYFFLLPQFTTQDPSHERINIPGIFSEMNWTLRFKPSLEDLLEESHFQQILRELIS